MGLRESDGHTAEGPKKEGYSAFSAVQYNGLGGGVPKRRNRRQAVGQEVLPQPQVTTDIRAIEAHHFMNYAHGLKDQYWQSSPVLGTELEKRSFVDEDKVQHQRASAGAGAGMRKSKFLYDHEGVQETRHRFGFFA